MRLRATPRLLAPFGAFLAGTGAVTGALAARAAPGAIPSAAWAFAPAMAAVILLSMCALVVAVTMRRPAWGSRVARAPHESPK